MSISSDVMSVLQIQHSFQSTGGRNRVHHNINFIVFSMTLQMHFNDCEEVEITCDEPNCAQKFKRKDVSDFLGGRSVKSLALLPYAFRWKNTSGNIARLRLAKFVTPRYYQLWSFLYSHVLMVLWSIMNDGGTSE